MRRPVLVGIAALFALAGCSTGNAAEDGNTVVATTTIWGSITEQIVACAGDAQTVTLMPVGADPHDYSAASSAVATMVGSELVVANGLGLEGGLKSALAAAEQDGANVLEVAPLLDPQPVSGASEDHAHEGDDPHVWNDMARAAKGAVLIGEELTQQSGVADYTTCGQDVSDDISATETEVVRILSAIPPEDRILVTDHDALGYFARAYGFTIAGVVIPSSSSLAEPSSAELASLTQTIKDTGVPAIFSNTATNASLVDALAAEAGDVEVVPLYVDSVGEPGTDAETYQGMMLANANAIAGALA